MDGDVGEDSPAMILVGASLRSGEEQEFTKETPLDIPTKIV
jgi:hypothetical protein